MKPNKTFFVISSLWALKFVKCCQGEGCVRSSNIGTKIWKFQPGPTFDTFPCRICRLHPRLKIRWWWDYNLITFGRQEVSRTPFWIKSACLNTENDTRVGLPGSRKTSTRWLLSSPSSSPTSGFFFKCVSMYNACWMFNRERSGAKP